MAVQKFADGAAQGSGAVSMHDAKLAYARHRGIVKKLVNCINCFVGPLTNDIQFEATEDWVSAS